MRVAYLLKRFPRLSQTFVLDELLELERQGVELVVLARRGSDEELVHDRVRDLRAPVHRLPDGADEHDVARLLREWGAQHVHAHFATWAAETACRAAALAGVPFSVTAHATDLYRADVDREALARRASAARFVVTVTEDNRRWLEGLLAERHLPGRVVRLYNGVDLDRLERSTAPRTPQLVVAVGRLVEKKGFDDLLTALATLRSEGAPVTAVLVGEGPLRDRLQERAATSGLQDALQLRGALRQEEVLDLVRRAAVFALPCVVAADGDRDALPTVLLEAMALGTPVVSTRVSGVPEMVDDGTSGLLVAERDPAALARALSAVLSEPDRSARLADAARERVEERFSLTRNVGVLRGLFEQAA